MNNEIFEIQGIKVFNRKNKRHIDTLVHFVRRHSLEFGIKVYGDLGNGIYYHSTPVRVLLNCYIVSVLENYGVSIENRKKLLYTSDFSKGKATEYLNNLLEVILKEHIDEEEIFISHLLADINSCFILIAIIVSGVVTKDHSLLDYLEAYEHVPEFRNIFTNPPVKKSDNPWKQEKILNGMMKHFENGDIVVSPITDFFKSKTKLNADQCKMFMQYGPIPYWEKSNEVKASILSGILNGVEDAKELWGLDQISRQAIITGKNDVKVTGIQSKRMSINLSDTKLNRADTREMIDDCKNTDYYVAKIESKKDLQFYRYSNFYNPETHEKLGYIDLDREDLIGQTLHIRTFVTCKGDVICKECFGHNWRFAADTKLFKGNINVDILEELNALLQKVISIKHHAAAKLKKCTLRWGEEEYDFPTFIENGQVFSDCDFDTFTIADNHTVEYRTTTEYDEYNKPHQRVVLFVDNKEFTTGQRIIPINDRTFKMIIPNDSVLSKADDLRIAINAHNAFNEQFDKFVKECNPNISEQMTMIIDYLRQQVNLDHFVYYEGLAHALIRDAEDGNSKITEDTKRLVFIHADDALRKTKGSKKISTKLPHGFMNCVLNSVTTATEPDEIDILYQNIADRKIRSRNVNAEFNDIINSKRSDDDELNLLGDDDDVIMNTGDEEDEE